MQNEDPLSDKTRGGADLLAPFRAFGANALFPIHPYRQPQPISQDHLTQLEVFQRPAPQSGLAIPVGHLRLTYRSARPKQPDHRPQGHSPSPSFAGPKQISHCQISPESAAPGHSAIRRSHAGCRNNRPDQTHRLAWIKPADPRQSARPADPMSHPLRSGGCFQPRSHRHVPRRSASRWPAPGPNCCQSALRGVANRNV